MPFALTLVGLLLIITGFQNTYRQLGAQVQSDFSGPGNFVYWLASVAVVGGLGYIKGLETFSRTFMILILLALVVAMYKKNPNIFADIGAGISKGTSTQTGPIGAPLAGGGGSGGGGGGSGFDLSNIGSDVSLITEAAGFFGF